MESTTLDILGKKVPANFKHIVISPIDGSPVSGFFITNQGMKDAEIQVLICKDKEEMAHTLIHELVHATLMRIGFYNTNLPIELEELICDNIATVLTENWKFQL